MNKIKLNNTEFEVESYNRTAYFNGETINCTGGCALITSNIDGLYELAEVPITSIQIYVNNESIYNLQNINARIENISEYFNGERFGVSVSLIFDTTSNS